jgi:OCT family organic cation transporter-like MFS transporter 18
MCFCVCVPCSQAAYVFLCLCAVYDWTYAACTCMCICVYVRTCEKCGFSPNRYAASHFALIQTVFSAVQLVGVVVAGPLIDLFGTRWMLLLSCWACLISYALTGVSYSLIVLYLSRVPTLLQHGCGNFLSKPLHAIRSPVVAPRDPSMNSAGLMHLFPPCTPPSFRILASRAYATEITEESNRAESLGRIGLAYGLAMAVAPILGGIVAQRTDLYMPSWLGCILTLGNLALLSWWIEEPRQDVRVCT